MNFLGLRHWPLAVLNTSLKCRLFNLFSFGVELKISQLNFGRANPLNADHIIAN
jgi:hypothetical protein